MKKILVITIKQIYFFMHTLQSFEKIIKEATMGFHQWALIVTISIFLMLLQLLVVLICIVIQVSFFLKNDLHNTDEH